MATQTIRNIGVLTGGGDCPGLNPVIRAVTRRATQDGITVIGIRNGGKGLVLSDTVPLDMQAVSGILHRGGTILGTSRTNPYKQPKDVEHVMANIEALKLDALVAVGGEDTLGVATKLAKDGVKVVGVPKTIDNDLSATDFTFGFDTAVNIAMEALDRLHSTAESHHRIMVAEIMGRHAGWIATYAGIAGGADIILIPEQPIDLDEVREVITKRRARGKEFSIIVVAEGAQFKDKKLQKQLEDNSTAAKAKDSFGHVQLGGVGHLLGALIEEQTGQETRVTVLGHLQRGGSPTAFDRVLGTRFGVHAVELILKGDFGKMVSLQGNQIVGVPLAKATGALKTVDPELYNVAKIFFG